VPPSLEQCLQYLQFLHALQIPCGLQRASIGSASRCARLAYSDALPKATSTARTPIVRFRIPISFGKSRTVPFFWRAAGRPAAEQLPRAENGATVAPFFFASACVCFNPHPPVGGGCNPYPQHTPSASVAFQRSSAATARELINRIRVLKPPRSTVFDTAWRWGYVERAWGVGAGAPLGACGAQFGAHDGA